MERNQPVLEKRMKRYRKGIINMLVIVPGEPPVLRKIELYWDFKNNGPVVHFIGKSQLQNTCASFSDEAIQKVKEHGIPTDEITMV